MKKNLTKADLERMLDEGGYDWLVMTLQEICYEKADHIRSNWQDEKLAKSWENRANKLGNSF